MDIHLIRHGKTLANEKQLFYGRTDLPLAENGKAELLVLKSQGIYPSPIELFFTSGLLRTEQTVDILYGSVSRTVVPDLAEYDFGRFEMKDYQELKEREDYQQWITDKTGTVPCPGGESKTQFRKRVIDGYSRIEDEILQTGAYSALVSCHGGTIACIMEFLQPNTDNYYGWLPQTGRGYTLIYASGRLHQYRPI